MSIKLKKLREEKGYSQEKLSELSNVSRTVISLIENKNAYTTTTDTLSKLANALDCKITDFFTDNV